MEQQQVAEEARTRVFLSYSRKDSALVGRVAEGLMAAGFLADYDQAAHDPGNVSAGISAEDEWWKRLQEMIAAADVMVFLVSPDSAASAVCDEEIAYARALGKRIIAALARPVDFAKAPPRLSALNVRIDFSEGGPGFDAALAALVSALQMNVGWHRDGRKYYARVQEWDTAGRPKSRLLREGAVEEAERWALARPRNEPEPGELFLAWIAASRAQIKRDAAVRAFWRRVTAVFVVTTLVATVAGAWFVVNGQRNLGRSESLMLARTSDQFYNRGDYTRALHLAILASRDSFLAPSTDEAKAAFARSAQALTHLVSMRQDLREGETGDPEVEKAIRGSAVSPDGTRLATWDDHGWVTLWDTASGQRVGVPFRMKWGVTSGAGEFSADSQRFVIWDQGGARVVEASTGAQAGGLLTDDVANVEDGVLAAAAFAPATNRLATLHPSGLIRLWDTQTAALVAETVLPDASRGGRMKMSDDGQILVAWSGDRVEFWQTETGEPAGPQLAAGTEVVNAALSPDNQLLVTWGNDTSAVLWGLGGGRADLTGCHSGQMVTAQFAAQTQRIVTQASGGEVCVWDAATGAQVGGMLRHQDHVDDVAISADGTRMFTVSYLTGPRLTVMETGEQIESPDDAGAVRGRFSPDGKYLLTQTNTEARLWHARTYESADMAEIREGSSMPAVFSPDGRYVAVQGAGEFTRVYPVSAGGLPGGALAHTHYTQAPRFLPGGRLLTLDRNRASIWQLENWSVTGPVLPEWGFHYGAMMSPDGKRVLTWTEEGQAALWDTFARTEIGDGLLVGEQGYWNAKFDTARPQMALWYEGALQLVNTDTGAGSEQLMEHEAQVQEAAFLAGGTRLLVQTYDGLVHLWDTETFKRLAGDLGQEGAYFPAVSPAGDRFAVSVGDAVELYDAGTGKLVGMPMVHVNHVPEDDLGGEVNVSAFSGDGRVLVTWNYGEVRTWNAADGTPLGPVIEIEGGVTFVVPSANGSVLAVMRNTDALVYAAASGEAVAPAMAHLQMVMAGALSEDGKTLVTLTQDYRGQLWDVETGKAKGDPMEVSSDDSFMRFFADDRRLLLWDHAGTQVVFDAQTGAELARNPQYDFFGEPVMDLDRGLMQTIDTNGSVRLMNIGFALRTDATPADVAEVCAAKLNSAVSARGVPFVRELDSQATFAAPILRGREGEDVCTAPEPAWWERAAGSVFGWAFR